MNVTGQITAWPNLIVDFPATVGALPPLVKGELGRELTIFTETFREALPRVILHSLSGGRSIVSVSIGTRGRVGTQVQNAGDQCCPRIPQELWHPQ